LSGNFEMEQRENWHLTEILEHAPGRSDPFAAAVRATRMPMVITDAKSADNPIVFANEAFQSPTGYDRLEIVGRNCRFLQGPDTDQSQVTRVKNAISAGEAIDVDLLNYRKDGTTFWNALYLSPVRNDAGDIIYFFASQMDVTERVEAQQTIAQQKAIIEGEVQRRTADLNAALEAKTVLLHEIDHRVKNNLTMIGSLLRLQARSVSDPIFSERLNAMLERVDALATVHRQLYQSEHLERFDIGGFSETLLGDVVGASGRHDIATACHCPPIFVQAAHATPLGLLLNEIYTNAIKHACDGRSGTLTVIARELDGAGEIEVTDDGPGRHDKPAKRGFGETLIQRLAKQIGAEIVYENRYPGTRVVVKFALKDE
jgi:PAS domain S-box-containing protein